MHVLATFAALRRVAAFLVVASALFADFWGLFALFANFFCRFLKFKQATGSILDLACGGKNPSDFCRKILRILRDFSLREKLAFG